MLGGVALVGFMGVGKTTVGQALGQALKLPFLDLDQVVVEQESCSIETLFSERGERAFRDAEKNALNRVLSGAPCVLSCGGGTPCQPGLMQQLNDWGHTIFLNAPFAVIAERAVDGGRPLWRNRSEALALYEKRLPVYKKAHIHLDASQPVSVIVDAAVRCLELRQ